MKLDVSRISNDNVAGLLERGLEAIRGGDVDFDLSAVSECNSAAVAMLLAWSREAQARGGALKLSGVPSNLLSLAKLYDVEGFVSASAG
jgi:phospholipid transport system transporter-binding protein